MALQKHGRFTVGTPPREAFEPEDQHYPGDGPPGGCLLIMAFVIALLSAVALWTYL